MNTITTERKSNDPCPECGAHKTVITGGISGDFWGPRGYEGVDITHYRCGECGEEWSD